MRCPFCGDIDNRVVDSRGAREGRAIRRRRECGACGERFTTYEEAEHTIVAVTKRDGSSEPFDRDKLVRSLTVACRKRPIPFQDIADWARELEQILLATPRRMVTSEELGNRVLAYLRDVDPVAYVRYASVYRSFDSVDAFLEAIRGVRPPAPAADAADDAP